MSHEIVIVGRTIYHDPRSMYRRTRGPAYIGDEEERSCHEFVGLKMIKNPYSGSKKW
jgi:hypothetical protein